MGAPLFGKKSNYKVDAEGKNLTGLRGKTKEELRAIVEKRKARDPESWKTGSTKEGSSYFYNDLQAVTMPEFEIGACIRCHKWDIELGDGLCMTCYDSLCDKTGARFNKKKWLQQKIP